MYPLNDSIKTLLDSHCLSEIVMYARRRRQPGSRGTASGLKEGDPFAGDTDGFTKKNQGEGIEGGRLSLWFMKKGGPFNRGSSLQAENRESSTWLGDKNVLLGWRRGETKVGK